MSKLIRFYQGKYPANGKKGYLFNDIVNKWSDYELEIRHDYIQWLFPDPIGGINPRGSKLTAVDLKVFKKNIKIRSNVINATVRMLLFYGYQINSDDWSLQRVKEIKRKERGRWIGLYATHNYLRITRILHFLNQIEMSFLSIIVFWAMCEAMRDDPEFRIKVKSDGALPIWMNTQKFLQKYSDGYDVDRMEWDIPSSREEFTDDEEFSDASSGEDVEYYWSGNSSSAEDSSGSEFENACTSFRGLDFTGNSCYQDSVLLATFAIPNDTTTDYILTKNVRLVSELPQRWTTCSENVETDFQRRKAIQNEIVRITNSMRKLDKSVRYCSVLRKLIQRCPGTEEFHLKGMQDAGEFLAYLFNLFQVDVATTSETTYVTNDLGDKPRWLRISSRRDEHASPIISVPVSSVESKQAKYINQFLVRSEDAVFTRENLYKHSTGNYRRRKLVWRMIESPYMVFYVHRLKREHYMRGQKFRVREKAYYTPVIPVQRIGRLGLSAVVVHSHDHYMCYIKCRGVWFFYDDNPSGRSHKIIRIGTYDEMLASRPSPVNNGTLYFYT